MGGSYGGYATLAGLAFTPEEFVCGVDIVGPSNLLTLLQTIPPYWEPIIAQFYKRMGRPEETEFLQARSPLFSAHQITKPLLIAQGANDPRVKQAESDQIVDAMRASGLPVEYLVFPDEGHGFARPENNRKFYAAAESFLAQYLGGRAEPPSEGERSDDLRR
jgi:dipeptidyl aminopeptidase/acylaminoacyl peptidase